MESLSEFLPVDRRRSLNEGVQMPDRVRGAALFADISGFTPLTGTLRRELGARRGAEELIGHVNNVFTGLIASIHRFGGNVIGFSGDAITCWFDDESREAGGAMTGACARAAGCAFELQQVMARRQSSTTPAGTGIPMGIKVAIAAGPARRFLVGDPGTYVIEVLAGSTLDRMAAAEKLAERGQVIVSSEVVDQIQPTPVVSEWHATGGQRFATLAALSTPVTPPTQEPIPHLPDEIARPWVLPPVYEHLRQGAAEFLAELRPAVPLFVKFSGIDYDGDDDAGKKLDIFVRRAQAILDHYEGYLLQITMGDKGSYLYASFGAPVAHENDTARAAAAALDLRDLPASLDFLHPLQIGISHGLTHSGAYGSPNRRTFAVMGNEVNLSARLMSAANPGQILISSRVAGYIDATFNVNPLPPIPLKGLDAPFPVAELLGHANVAHRFQSSPDSATIAGREAERTRLNQALLELGSGQSSVAIIEGAAGIGKSLLIQELIQKAEASDRPPLVLAGFGDPIERSTSYFAWRPIIERIISDLPAGEDKQTSAVWREIVARRLPAETQPLAPLLNPVLPLDLPENELTEQMSGEVRQENTQRLLVDLIKNAAGEAPVLLVMDDGQWLDSVSWTLVQRAQREINPLLMAITTRLAGDDPSTVYKEFLALAGTRHIVLDTLPRAAIEELVAQRLGVRRLPPEAVKLIYQKAEGHPFFSEELAYALRDAGLLIVEDHEARLAPDANFENLDFPDTIQGVITSRIDRLPPQQQLTVKVASVIGRIFAFRVLNNIYPVSLDENLLREYLDHLDRLDITSQEEPEPNLSYIFKHLVTQEVVYSLMTSSQRRQLHRNTAVWYEAVEQSDLNRNLPLLAHHWQMAGELAKAAEYYDKAGEKAFRDYANQEAVTFLHQAETLSASHSPALRRARRHRLMGEAYYRLTQIENCLAEYETALKFLDHSVPQSVAGRGLGLTRELVRQLAFRALPRRFVVRPAQGEEREILLEASRVLEGVSEIHYNIGDFVATFYCTMTAFNLAEIAGPSPELMRGYANMCATLGAVALNSAADGYRARALELEPSIDDLPARAWSRIPLSTHSLWVGNWARAEREIGEALDIYTQLGDWRRWSVAAWLWPQVAQCRGQLERARDLWAELYDMAVRSRDLRHQVRGRGGQFFNFLSLGQPDAAQECLARMRSIMDENPEMMPVEERLWHAINAAWALEMAEGEQAKEAAIETLAAIDRARFKFDLLEVFSTPAEVLLRLWERGEATEAEATAACKVLSSYARTYAFARPRASRAAGRAAWLAGERKKAARLWNKSVTQADELGMPHERELTEAIRQR